MVPLLMTFFSVVQLGKLYTTQLVFKHAAVVAARAATVIVSKDINPGASGDAAEVQAAAVTALGPFAASFRTVTTEVFGGRGPDDELTVELRGTYTCSVPLGNILVCGAGTTHTFKPVSVTLQLNGARYEVEK
jgi:hypothetical protein